MTHVIVVVRLSHQVQLCDHVHTEHDVGEVVLEQVVFNNFEQVMLLDFLHKLLPDTLLLLLLKMKRLE